MDRLALPGMLLGIGLVVLALVLEGGAVSSLLNGPAAIIVLGGSLAATLVQCPWQRLKRWLQMLGWTLVPPRDNAEELVFNLMDWSNRCRQHGILALEGLSERHEDPFVRRGLQMLVDGNEAEHIREVMESQMLLAQDHDYKAADTFQIMGGYAPTMGILGAVLGLIQAMAQLTDPQALGAGIATAFVATIYGVGFANLVFLPLAGRLHGLIDHRSRCQEAAIVGLTGIAAGEHPAKLQIKLNAYLVG
ncbi:flagellar motor protein [Gallaecimonas sp. GXIMD4217]|uniref:flagellar motor protein n=1 Tax=Gallaecimonas sp. GXIMD4217 TaxID=3131927 RepID=UPI00311B00B0